MVSFEDIKTVYDEIPLERLVENYERRQRQAISQDSKQFNVFLAKFNQILNDKRIIPFYKTILHEIVRNISKEGYVYDLSHNMAVPLEDFRRYYSSPKFSISSEEFRELSDRVREEYNYTLYMHHLDEVGRSLRMIK